MVSHELGRWLVAVAAAYRHPPSQSNADAQPNGYASPPGGLP